LDHPAFVLDGNGQGIAFGSVGFERIKNLLKRGSLDLRVFAPSGEFLTLGQLTDLNEFIVSVQTEEKIPPNSHGIWDVTDFEIVGDEVRMYSADNMIVTDVMLALIERIASNPEEFPNLDVTFVFTFLEEVFEVSASALSMNRRTPFGDRIDERWIVIVLESMECIPLLAMERHFGESNLRNLRVNEDNRTVALRVESFSSQQFHPLYTQMDLPLPSSSKGVMLKINDMDCVYGYEFVDSPNLAENLVLSVVEDLDVRFQHTLYGGACNATAYSIFKTTANIVTLSVPNPYKHNILSDGSVGYESVRLEDIDTVAKILIKVLKTCEMAPPQSHQDSLNEYLKTTTLVPPQAIAKKLRAERGTIAWSFRWRLRKGRYFGVNLLETALFYFRAAAAHGRKLLFGFKN